MKFYSDKLVLHRKESHLTGDRIAKAMNVIVPLTGNRGSTISLKSPYIVT